MFAATSFTKSAYLCLYANYDPCVHSILLLAHQIIENMSPKDQRLQPAINMIFGKWANLEDFNIQIKVPVAHMPHPP